MGKNYVCLFIGRKCDAKRNQQHIIYECKKIKTKGEQGETRRDEIRQDQDQDQNQDQDKDQDQDQDKTRQDTENKKSAVDMQ